jgi:MFS family permease
MPEATTKNRQEPPASPPCDDIGPVSPQSRIGLNAVNFFLAEVIGVVLPFLSAFLQMNQWRYDAIGVAVAVAGLGTLLMQTPAGFIVDRVRQRRFLLAVASLVLGACYGLLPVVAHHEGMTDSLLFVAGIGQAFFVPLLGALALGLVGHAALSKTMGVNQGWNHAGNIAAAVSAMALVGWFSISSIFYAVTVVSVLAAASVFLIRPDELDEWRASGVTANGDGRTHPVGLWELFRDRRVVVLFAATALFHLANAPVMPLVALYVKQLQGSDHLVAAVVLVAQVVMIPVALLTGWLCDRWGRKPVFAIGFVALPMRIFLYSLSTDPGELVALQALDGIGAGIYGVAVVSVCADLTRGKGRFNALAGLLATAVAVGGVIGPLGAGFHVFAGIAAVAAFLFLVFMPETRPGALAPPLGRVQAQAAAVERPLAAGEAG